MMKEQSESSADAKSFEEPAAPVSRSLYERALQVMPGGNSRHSVFFHPYPLYAARGEGSRIVDVEGVERIDFVNNFSSLIHGHGHPAVVAAVTEQAGKLMAAGLPTELEIELAELIAGRVPGVEQVRFTNSGTEAVMMALKAARAFTARPVIAKFEGCYHGTYDPAEASQAPPSDAWGDPDRPATVALSKGTPNSLIADTLVLPFNDLLAAQRLLEENQDRIAGILVDPYPSHLGYLGLGPEMLSMIEDFTRSARALFILDEVYSLRFGYGGTQGELGLEPDLTVMGKIIGGGLPIGAVGGSAEAMAVFDPRRPAIAHGGTYNANPMSMAAGLASMRALERTDFDRLAKLGDHLRSELKNLARVHHVGAIIGGVGSAISITFSDVPVQSFRDIAALPDHRRKVAAFHRALLANGVLITPQGAAVLSTAMTGEDAELFLEAADAAFAVP